MINIQNKFAFSIGGFNK